MPENGEKAASEKLNLDAFGQQKCTKCTYDAAEKTRMCGANTNISLWSRTTRREMYQHWAEGARWHLSGIVFFFFFFFLNKGGNNKHHNCTI